METSWITDRADTALGYSPCPGNQPMLNLEVVGNLSVKIIFPSAVFALSMIHELAII